MVTMADAATDADHQDIPCGASNDVESPLVVEYREEDVAFVRPCAPALPSLRKAEVDRCRRVRPRTVGLGALALVTCLVLRRSARSSGESNGGSSGNGDDGASEQAVVWSFGSLVQVEDSSCHTAVPGELCFDKVLYAMHEGIQEHPEWYEGLTEHSTASEFQRHFQKTGYGDCKLPCQRGEADSAWKPKVKCLCIFDIDRTLTSKQALADKCPGAKAIGYHHDNAYGGGQLVLSQLALDLDSTFCSNCHLGTVSAGTTGPDEQELIASLLPGTEAVWSPMWSVKSPLVVNCSDAKKAQCVDHIWNWYKNTKKIDIPKREVFFFDDQTVNSGDFSAKGFNAHQVSCKSRDFPSAIGACGAESSEITRDYGTLTCATAPHTTPRPPAESHEKVKVRSPEDKASAEAQGHHHGAMRKRGNAVEGASPEIVEAFTIYDANINNLISKGEFSRTYGLLHAERESEDLDAKFDSADANKDGQLDYKEFAEWQRSS